MLTPRELKNKRAVRTPPLDSFRSFSVSKEGKSGKPTVPSYVAPGLTCAVLALTYALGLTYEKTGRPSAYSCHQNNLESSWYSVALARFWQVVSYEPLWILGFQLPAKLCPDYGHRPAELLAPLNPCRS
jgi:hypothetical protein